MTVHPLRSESLPVFDIWHGVLRLATEEHLQFIDLTSRVKAELAASGVSDGLVNVQSLHTTAAVIVNENEPFLLEDLKEFLDRMAPRAGVWRHDDFSRRIVPPGERKNGHSHAQSVLLSASASLNVMDGELQLGRWQRVFLVELDGPRERELSMTVMGSVYGPQPRVDRRLCGS